MNVASRPAATGKTRICPHCKATILESLSICPGCLHHLRFDQEAAKRQVAATSALRVEGVIQHPPLEDPWEYFVVLAVRNGRGEEVARQVVSVGALQSTEKRSFTLSVEVLSPQTAAGNGPPKATALRPAAPSAAKPTPATPARPAPGAPFSKPATVGAAAKSAVSTPPRPATGPPPRPATGPPPQPLVGTTPNAGGAPPPPAGGAKR